MSCGSLLAAASACPLILGELVGRPALSPVSESDRGGGAQPLEEQLQSLFSQARAQALGALDAQVGDPAWMANAHFENLLFSDKHPRGRFPTWSSINRIRLADLQAHLTQYVRPERATLVVTGNADTASIKALVERTFTRWTSKGIAGKREGFRVRKAEGSRVLLVDNPAASATTLLLGQRAPAASHRDWVPFAVLNEAIAGSGLGDAAVLPRVVRSQLRLTGDIVSSVAETGIDGTLKIFTTTSHERAVPALMAIANQLTLVRNDGVPADQVTFAQIRTVGAFSKQVSGVSGLAKRILRAELSRRGLKGIVRFPPFVSQATPVRLQDTAKSWLNPTSMVVVMVGRAGVIGPMLEKANIVYEQVPESAPLSFAHRARLRQQAAQAAKDGGAQKARAVLEKGWAAQKGMSGVSRLQVHRSGERKLGDRLIDLEAVTHFERPGRARLEQTVVLKEGRQSQTLLMTPDGVWQKQGGNAFSPAGAGDAARFRQRIFEAPEFFVGNLLAHEPPLPMTLVGDVKRQGRMLTKVRVMTPGGEWNVLWFETKAGLLRESPFSPGGRISGGTTGDILRPDRAI